MSESHSGSHEKTYIKIFIALLVFTVGTFLFAETLFKDNKFATICAVMLIAVIKATLVIRFFMHLKFEGSWKYVLLVPTCIMAALLVLALLPDIGKLGAWSLNW